MLILARKIGQSFQMGSNINITIKGFEDGQVILGIDAPRDIGYTTFRHTRSWASVMMMK